jgi:hypothetical protein
MYDGYVCIYVITPRKIILLITNKYIVKRDIAAAKMLNFFIFSGRQN